MTAEPENIVYIATSLDGMIAGPDGDLDWLPESVDESNALYTFAGFMDSVDAIVMGRTTYETVLGFGIEWPYAKPVFVLSTTLTEVPDTLKGKVEITSGTPSEITNTLNAKGFNRLYIDGGAVIRGVLNANLIHRLIITRIPTVLGGGTSLFSGVNGPLTLSHIRTAALSGGLPMSEYQQVAA